jgi:hypothetical protein
MFVEQLIKKKEENMISGSVGGMCIFLLFTGRPLLSPLFLLSFFLYPKKPLSLFYKIVIP